MDRRRLAKINLIAVTATVCFLVLAAVVAVFTVPALRAMAGLKPREPADEGGDAARQGAAQVIYDADGKPGLRLTKAAIWGYQIKPIAVRDATRARPLPLQVGTLNFENESLFQVPARFPGEIAEIRQVDDDVSDNISDKATKKRPLRYGDRFKQGELLAVLHSPTLGAAKAALVDAVCSLKLSTETLERHQMLFKEGGLSYSQLKLSERQKQADSNTLLTAERTLLTMKLSEEEVNDVKEEANKIAELASAGKLNRKATDEVEKWARVEIKVPVFDKATKDTRELTVVEKNTNVYSMVDPIATSAPLFKLADVGRLQVWVHPSEEYLPIFRTMLDSAERGGPFWTIGIPAYPDDKLPPMRFYQYAPSLEPFQHAPMLMGYLTNPNGNRYVVGQFVTATIDLPPEPNTVEVPTEAINEIGGEALVFVQPDPGKLEFIQRRVAVVHRFKDVTIVRSRLTKVEEDENARNSKRAGSQRLIETLKPGALVMTRGVVELTSALEGLLLEEGNKGGAKK
jgi:membrane fusion protein, heavy metal efflux system